MRLPSSPRMPSSGRAASSAFTMSSSAARSTSVTMSVRVDFVPTSMVPRDAWPRPSSSSGPADRATDAASSVNDANEAGGTAGMGR